MAPTYKDPNPVWTSIPGFFDFEPIYEGFVNRAKDGDVLVEVGCYLGRSACFLGEEIRKSGKKVKLLCVDTWPPVYTPPSCFKIEAPFEVFLANVRQSYLTDIIIPIRCKSVVAASFVRNNLRCVFIDAEHSYAECAADIKAWLPKVMHGGLLAGHDYNGSFPGVIQAVDEAFPGNSKRIRGNCWLRDIP